MNYCESFCRTIQRLCNSTPPLLPPEYQQVEWIQGGNGQYINTGEKPTQTLGIEGGGVFGVEGGDNYTLLGCRTAVNIAYVLQGLTSGFRLTYGSTFNTIQITDCIWFSFKPGVEKTFYYKRGNGTTGSAAISGTAPNINTAFYIGAINNNGSVVSSTAIINYFKMFSGDTLIHDFIPCYRKIDNKTGMYDLVTDAFFANAGSGEFTVGNNI